MIDPLDRWQIWNDKTCTLLETWPDEYKAIYFCAVMNKHEINNGRSPIYRVAKREDYGLS